MFTLFIVPGHPTVDNPKAVIDSWRGFPDKIEITDRRVIPSGTINSNDWYGYMHANEILSEDLIEAIPKYISMGFADCFVFYKKIFDWLRAKERIFTTPRIFKGYVELRPGNLYPVNSTYLKFEKCLDGWLLDAPTRTIPHTRS